MNLSDFIRDIPDYPKQGIIFKDITPLWKNPESFRESIEKLAEKFKSENIDKVVGAEARGFIIGAAMAYNLNSGFVPVRKPKKLPYKYIEETYELEYGIDSLAMHIDAVEKGERVLIVDDLIATGGTSQSIAKLVERLEGKIVSFAFLVELEFLKGWEKIKEYPIFSLIKY